jgi:NAD(P)-dependent dehydrogenase (short-subunit alcohol dehydrogenase family)
MSHEDIEQIVRTNCLSVLHWLREILPRMRKHPSPSWPDKKGHVVLVSSRSGERTLPNLSPYTVAKGGVEKIAEAMQREYARFGIVFTLVNPGSINTAFTQSWDQEARNAHNAESMPIDYILDAILLAIQGNVAVNKVSMESVRQWKGELGVLK